MGLLRERDKLCANCGATVTFRVVHALTSANVPSERAAYANTCAVAPSAVSDWLTLAVTPAVLVEEAGTDGDTATDAPVSAYARMLEINTDVGLTVRVLDAPAAEMVTVPRETPDTAWPTTAATAALLDVKVASRVRSTLDSVVRPTPPRSANSRKSAVSYVQGDSCCSTTCVACRRVASGYHTRSVTDVEKPPLVAVTMAATLPAVLLVPSVTEHPPPCATPTVSTAGAFVAQPPPVRVTAESPGDARGVP